MNDGLLKLRPRLLPVTAALIALLGTAACDATKQSASNSTTDAQNVIVPVDETQGADRSGVESEMDGRGAMHNEMSGHNAMGQSNATDPGGMKPGMGGMMDDHMKMKSGKMPLGDPPADPPKDAPMKDDM